MTEVFEKLTNIIKKADNVIIMTHKNMDLDALGSALCLSRIVSHLGIKNWFVFNKKDNNLSISKALSLLKKGSLKVNFAGLKKAQNLIGENSLLIIIDTSKKELVEFPELLTIKQKIIIDHHPIGNKNISDVAFSYINASQSSTNEILVEYLKHLNLTIAPIIATIMLAGIEVDTNSYGIKTTAKTFRASAFLLEMGAVNFLKYDILKEDKKEYLKREKHLEKSYIVFNKFAICKIEKKIAKEDLSVIAEKMLTFDQVEAAFAIGKIEKNGVAISARSLGETNVYQIMKEFDGGGHFTEAATQIKNQELNKIEKQLIEKLEVIK